VSTRTVRSPRCIIIAGPNGAGKTTFAREFLLRETGVIHFVNADLIAGGLSPLRPELAARQAGRLVLMELTRLARDRKDFAFESTLSGRTYLRDIRSPSYSCLSLHHNLPFNVLLPEFAKAGMTFLAQTCCDAFNAVGTIIIRCIVHWPMVGRSTTIPAMRLHCWRKVHEDNQ
jgi:hypothetical protein